MFFEGKVNQDMDLHRKNVDTKKQTKLTKPLYPDLPRCEILVLTAVWIFGIGYSNYHVYLASKSKLCFVNTYLIIFASISDCLYVCHSQK